MISNKNDSKTIIYIVSYFPSTSQTFVLREIKQLREMGYSIKIIAMRESDKEIKHKDSDLFINDVFYIPDIGKNKRNLFRLLLNNLPLIFSRPTRYGVALGRAIKTKSPRVMLDLLRAGWVVSKNKIDYELHLHAHFAHNPTNIAYFIHLLNGNNFSFTSHAVDLYVSPKLIKEKLLASSFAITISEFNVQFLRERYGQEAVKRLHIVRCGIEKDQVNKIIRKKKAELKKEKISILSIGRMVEKKGFDVLIDALDLLNHRGYDFECHIIGGGELKEELIQQVKDKGLSQRVDFFGAKSSDEIQAEFANADIFILPCKMTSNGDMDGIPVVLMEAIANTVPVISTRLSGIPELVINGKTGLLAEPNNPSSLVDQMELLITKSELREKLTNQALKHLINEFLLEENVTKLANLMKSELKG
jgi:colanic acid/amylovoran biosynthesis glycosyltransferase